MAKLLYLCEGLTLLSVDLIPKSRKPFTLLRGACLEPAFPTACTTHVWLRRMEGGREGLGTSFSLEVPLKTIFFFG